MREREMRRAGVAATSEKRERRQRFSRAASAASTIRGFDQTTDISFGLTLGQFSLVDLIEATLAITGPADVAVATWAVGYQDLEQLVRLREAKRVWSLRIVMDSSDKKGQATTRDVVAAVGLDGMRATRTHAKFVLITNPSWGVVIQTSMNLNLNERGEQFSMTNCQGTAAFVESVLSALWDEVPPGAHEQRTSPLLAGVPAVAPEFGFEVSPLSAVRVGTVSDG
jgi:hypothetical protein